MTDIELRTSRHVLTARVPVGALVAGVVAAFLIACAVAPAAIAPYDPLAVQPADAFKAPSADHWFGTDESGRDIFSRAVFGARASLLIGVASTAIGLVLGGALGLVGGLAGRFAHLATGRLIEVLFAFPGLLLALLVIVIVGPGPVSVTIAVGLSTAPGYARIVQGRVLAIRASGYVEAARVLGHSAARIVWRTIVPNTAAPLVVLATLGIGQAVVWAASLSYLGLGTQPPSPEWGAMLNAGRTYMQTAAWMTIMPGLLILATTISFTVLGRRLAKSTGGAV
ncbi:peptide/nickel transport system permease protein [Paramicrobacterium humi]|uniref:Peptide/nickel transport system permease protein n=1 Tax=Paramicrobacterium humi TaxID=640635 RepID=A0A1H4Q7M3_9MICO|nr:ABC transporter permease [Microbacterium humi]SEC15626.1 peptide/nickel transport system permease protein [Microbacterium humi]